MCRRIALIQGHPDPAGGHFCNALAEAYTAGARAAGHHVDLIEVAALDVPFLRSRNALEYDETPPQIQLAQQTIAAADHVVVVHPIWNGGAPALLRAFMEQTFRPSFIFPGLKPGEHLGFSAAFREQKRLRDKTARVVATMQMPAFVYRWYFRPHQEASALRLGGAAPVKETLIGFVEATDGSKREQWLRRMRILGAEGK
ncbi:MAG: NAD(P)H-dependent oxidoreductase [Acidobacteriota bacterium]|nr:NAD(P)H-dependent oxidoreductase [Acidobacteriota bacterium]